MEMKGGGGAVVAVVAVVCVCAEATPNASSVAALPAKRAEIGRAMMRSLKRLPAQPPPPGCITSSVTARYS
jgi:hypothetical protein